MEKSIDISDISSNKKLSEKIIWILMYILSIIHGLMEVVPGMLSSCVTEIKHDFNLTDKEFGLFGTFSGFGSFLGSLVFTLVIERANHKYLISSMLLTNCISHFSFFFKFKYPSLLSSRFLCGFVNVFCFIYFPMWVDRFAMKKWVNFMQTFVQVSNTIGHIFGYFVYLFLGGKNWKYGFLFESLSISFLVFLMLLIPFKYYDKNYKNLEFVEETNNSSEIKMEEENETIIKDIICNVPYVLVSFYRGNRLFIFGAINYWYSDYLQKTLMEKNASKIFGSYSMIIISSLIGQLIGGIIINLIGGTRSKHCYFAMAILQFICVLFGFCAPFTKSVLIFTILMSLYILINAASGIISISASFAVMPKSLTGTATGMYSLLVNLIAFLPASYAYAFIKSLVGDKYVIIVLMSYGLFGCFELILADIYMRVKKIKLYKEEDLISKEIELGNIIH